MPYFKKSFLVSGVTTSKELDRKAMMLVANER
jgi:hypothetical protein